MKNISIALACLCALSAFADIDYAKSAFLNDMNVKDAIQKVPDTYEVSWTPQAVFIREGCGVVGCITEYMVGMPVMGKSINPQSTSILAKVKIRNGNQVMSVQLLTKSLCDISGQ